MMFLSESGRDGLAQDRFSCSVRERAAFEAGIKLATVYHQFVGTPFNSESILCLEKSIEEAIKVQPYVESAEIHIDRSVLKEGGDRYSYVSLEGTMIDAIVVISLNGVKVTAEMRYDKELDYPLMYISKIE
jgi:hypothetical protein